jgi:hypothetical protein
MVLIVAVHKWKPEVEITITKEMIYGFTLLLEGKQPQGIKLQTTQMRSDHGAFCTWEAPSKEELENFFKKFGPTLLKATEFSPVLQAFPATVEYELSLLKMITDLASK